MTDHINNGTVERIQTQLEQLVTLVPELNESGQPAGLLWADIQKELAKLTHDITERKTQEAERERLAALYDSSRAIAGALSERQTFDALFEQIRGQTPCEISVYRFDLVDGEAIWAKLSVNWQKINRPTYPEGARFYLPENDQIRLLTTSEPIFIDDIASDERLTAAERDSFSPTAARSVAIMPLVARRQKLGAVMVYFTTPYTFTDHTKQLWLALIDQVCVGLANLELLQEATFHVVQMETAAEVARAASSILDLQDLLNATVNLVRDRFNLYYVGVFLVDEAQEWAVLRAGTGKAGQAQLEKGHRLKIGGESMIGWSVHHRQPRIALDVGKEAVHFQNPDLPDTRSEMALPLISRNDVIGALTIQSVEPAAFSTEDIIILQVMADQLANAIQNARLFQKAQQEIIERKQAEGALRASEALYSSLVESLPQNIFRKDLKGRFTFANSSFCAMEGKTSEEVIGKTDFELYPADMAKKFQDDDRRIMEAGEIFEIAEKHPLPNGEVGYVRTVKIPIYDAAGQVIGIQGMFWDITERQRAQEALQFQKTLLEAQGEASPDGIMVVSKDRKILSSNRRFAEMWHIPDHVMKTESSQAAIEVIQDMVADSEEYLNRVEYLYTHEDMESREEILLKDGRTFDRYSAPVKSPEGAYYGRVWYFRDITERKQTEEALRVSEERFALAVRGSNDGIWDWDIVNHTLYWSPRLKELLGYEPDELEVTFDTFEIHLHPDDGELMQQAIETHLQQQEPYDVEQRLRAKSGEYRWFRARGQAVWDEAGRPLRMTGSSTDITDQKNAEEALRRSEERYRSIYNNTPVMMHSIDKQARLISVSDYWLEAMGYERDEVIGRNVYDFVTEESRRYGEEVTLPEFLKTGVSKDIPYQFVKKNGEIMDVLLSGAAQRNEAGDIERSLTVLVDVTQLKRAEAALAYERDLVQAMMDNSPDYIFFKDTESRFLRTNNAHARQLLGIADPQEVLGKTDFDFFPHEIAQASHDQEQQVMQTGQPIVANEWPIPNPSKGGEIVWLSEHKIPLRDEGGQVIGLAGLARDITPRKQAEEALRKSEATSRALFNAIPDLIFSLDRDGTYLDFKPTEVGLGIRGSREERLGRKLHDFLPKAVADMFVQAVRQALDTGETQISEYQLPRDGVRRDREARTVPLSEGEALTIVRDITERKQIELIRLEALRRTQHLYNITEALATSTDQQAAFETVLGQYLLLLRLNRGGIMLFNRASNQNTLVTLYADGKVTEPNLKIPTEEDLIAQYLVENPQPLVIEDAHTHPLTKGTQALRSHVGSMLLHPLVIKGEVVGILGADAPEKGYNFTQDDIESGEAIADQLSIWLENSRLLNEAQHRSNLLQTGAEVSKQASSLLDVDELINTSVNFIRDQFDFYYVGLFLVDGAREWAVLRAGTGEAGRIQLEKGHRLKIGDESMIGWCVKRCQARIALDVGNDPVQFKNPYLPDTHSEMALPLSSREDVLGALTVQSVERGAFSDEDITVLQTMADQLANAIANANLFENVAHSQRTAEALLQETQALHQLSQALAGTLQVNEILDLFFQACTQDIGFEYVMFCLVDKYQNRVKAISGVGIPDSQIQRSNRPLDSNDIMANIVRTGQTEIITGWDDRFDRETFEAEGHDNWVRIFTPITLRQEQIGLIEAGFMQPDVTIEDSQLRLLRAFVDQTALALDNAQRYEASQQAAQREAQIKEIIAKVRASTDLDTILQTTVKEVGEAIGGKRSYVHLLMPTNGDSTDGQS